MRMEGEWVYIGGGTMARSVYRKEKMGAPKKPAMYPHIQIESGAHWVGWTPENVNNVFLLSWFLMCAPDCLCDRHDELGERFEHYFLEGSVNVGASNLLLNWIGLNSLWSRWRAIRCGVCHTARSLMSSCEVYLQRVTVSDMYQCDKQVHGKVRLLGFPWEVAQCFQRIAVGILSS